MFALIRCQCGADVAAPITPTGIAPTLCPRCRTRLAAPVPPPPEHMPLVDVVTTGLGSLDVVTTGLGALDVVPPTERAWIAFVDTLPPPRRGRKRRP